MSRLSRYCFVILAQALLARPLWADGGGKPGARAAGFGLTILAVDFLSAARHAELDERDAREFKTSMDQRAIAFHLLDSSSIVVPAYTWRQGDRIAGDAKRSRSGALTSWIIGGGFAVFAVASLQSDLDQFGATRLSGVALAIIGAVRVAASISADRQSDAAERLRFTSIGFAFHTPGGYLGVSSAFTAQFEKRMASRESTYQRSTGILSLAAAASLFAIGWSNPKQEVQPMIFATGHDQIILGLRMVTERWQ